MVYYKKILFLLKCVIFYIKEDYRFFVICDMDLSSHKYYAILLYAAYPKF